jgi:hypothetical protein
MLTLDFLVYSFLAVVVVSIFCIIYNITKIVYNTLNNKNFLSLDNFNNFFALYSCVYFLLGFLYEFRENKSIMIIIQFLTPILTIFYISYAWKVLKKDTIIKFLAIALAVLFFFVCFFSGKTPMNILNGFGKLGGMGGSS